MSEQPDFSAISSVAHGDERLARHLRATLAVIARRTEDPDLRRLVSSVLRGEQSVRRVFEHPTFWAMAQRNLDNLEAGLDRLSDEERDEVMGRVGEQYTPDEDVEAMREQRNR